MYILYAVSTIFTWAEIFLFFIIFFPVQVFFFLLTLPFDRHKKVIHYIASALARTALFISPVFRVKITGRENIDRSKPHVIVMNHQSLLDILLSFLLYYPCRMVAKKVLARVPFLGWELVIFGNIFVERDNRKSQFEAIRKMEELIHKGNSMLVYPEGTRSRDGEIAEFKKGAFRSATSTGTAVMPVLLDGPFQALPKKGIIVDGVYTLHMHVMPEIPVSVGDNPAELALKTHQLMCERLALQRGTNNL